ncbi:hypothetical protein RR46_14411 [Papilio xuthus]|uniref:Uncharacterized protein n=1 Tax=Papilio xuthus TaxID=66420 RepID=A0A194PCI8_PAPXU|nr:hypothetical protein RR46_14411 [Papilio xuthus]
MVSFTAMWNGFVVSEGDVVGTQNVANKRAKRTRTPSCFKKFEVENAISDSGSFVYMHVINPDVDKLYRIRRLSQTRVKSGDKALQINSVRLFGKAKEVAVGAFEAQCCGIK